MTNAWSQRQVCAGDATHHAWNAAHLVSKRSRLQHKAQKARGKEFRARSDFPEGMPNRALKGAKTHELTASANNSTASPAC